MTSPAERLYELAQSAVDEQRQSIANARNAVPSAGAAAAVIAGGLAKTAFGHAGEINTAAALIGAAGAAFVLVFGVLLFTKPSSPVYVAFPVRPLIDEMEPVMSDGDDFHFVLAQYIDEKRESNRRGIDQIGVRLFWMLFGLVLEAGGFLVAAVVHF